MRRNRPTSAKHSRLIVWSLPALLFALLPEAASAGPLQTIVLSGEAALGGTFVNFTEVALSDNGQVAFVSEVEGPGIDATSNKMIWKGSQGALTFVAQSGTQAPGLDPGIHFVGDFSDLRINNAGQSAFSSSVSGPGVTFSNDGALWSEGTGALGLLAREGDEAAGLGPGVQYAAFFAGQDLNDLGRSAFAGGLAGTGVGSSNNQAIWSQPAGVTTPLARTGDQAPDAPAGANFQAFNTPDVNNNDQTAFRATLVGGGVNASNNEAIWSDRGGALAMIARTGDEAPGNPMDVRFSALNDPRLNDAGEIAFRAAVAGPGIDATNNVGLWAEQGTTLERVTQTGEVAPGTPGAVFAGLANPAQNNGGRLAFDADLTGAGVTTANDRGVWAQASDGSLNLIAREGQEAPGTGGGVLFSNFSAPLLNDDGQVALLGFLNGTGVTPGNARGIWATDRMGILQLIVREGDPIEVAPGEFREVALLANPRATQLPGFAFNALGGFAFWATFTDGSSGVFVSTLVAIPEPAAGLLLCAAACYGLRRRKP